MSKLTEKEIEQAQSDIVFVIQSYGVELHSHGKEYRALCPFHAEKTASFTVTPSLGRYHCFSCGANGDSIEFVMQFATTDFRSAVQLINNTSQNTDTPHHTPIKIAPETQSNWTPCDAVPDDAPIPMDVLNQKVDGKWIKYHSKTRWEYKNKDGNLIGYVYRFELPEGGKITAPQTWCVNKDGELSWRWQAIGKPRPVFGLDLLMANPLANVLVVEGEKTCCAARNYLASIGSKAIAVSWCGGGMAVRHTDWSPLIGRKLCLWPDADKKTFKEPHDLAGQVMPFMQQPGTVAMLEINKILDHPQNCTIIIPDQKWPDGWDLADELPSGFDFIAHLKNAIPVSQAGTFSIKTDVVEEKKEERKRRSKADAQDPIKNNYFKILGYDHGHYYIYQCQRGQVDYYSVGALSEKGLLELAPQNWWEQNFPGSKASFDTMNAVDYILRCAELHGIYDIDKVRGRGAWIDKKRIVFHHGDFLTVDGEVMEINEFPSKYVYEKGKVFPDLPTSPLSDDDGRKIFEMATDFRWTTPGSGVLLAGWIALAPICGALNWRPHIWLQGGPSSGKSSIMNMFVHPLMNGIDAYFQGSTTEPGLRQVLGSDALPVLFDESESNTEKDGLRIQNVLALIRQSSTETDAKTVKGSSSGVANTFHIRSMFCMSSIQTALIEQADKGRVTILALQPALKDKAAISDFWPKMQSKLNSFTDDEDFAGRLIIRSLNQLTTTLKNIKVFTNAAAEFFGAQREGDQYGTLLAGAWSLLSDQLVTKDEALNYIQCYKWEEYRENSDANDSETAFMVLMSTFIKIPGYVEVPVSDLILTVCGRKVDGLNIRIDEARNSLSNYGMKVENQNELIICNHHIQLNSLMKHTPFSADLKSVLLRYKGAKRLEHKHRFSGISSRAYSIPLDELLNDNEVEL